jgi:putative transposase
MPYILLKYFGEKEVIVMLSEDEFEVWCFQHALSEQAKTVIRQIRSSPPSRLVRSAAGNVSGRYPSRENGLYHPI